MKLMIKNDLSRIIITPDGVLDYFVTAGESLEYNSYFERVSRHNLLSDVLRSLHTSIRQYESAFFSSDNAIILNYSKLKDIVTRELSSINGVASLHGLARNNQLLVGENRGFEIVFNDLGVSIFVSGCLSYVLKSNMVCIGVELKNGNINEITSSISDNYIRRAFQKPTLADTLASLFTDNFVSKRIAGVGEVYEIASSAYKEGVYDVSEDGVTPTLQVSYLTDLKTNELMANINNMYAILVESSSVVVPGLSAALKEKSAGVTELNSQRPLFITQSGNLGVDPFITARAEIARVEALGEFKSDDEILNLSTNLTECAKLSGEMTVYQDDFKELASDGIMLYDEVTNVSDFISDAITGSVLRTLSNVYASRVEGISPTDNVGKYDIIKFDSDTQISLADWTGVKNMVNDALKELEQQEDYYLTMLSSSGFENINEKLEELTATYDLQIRTLASTLAKQSQLTAKATAMLENIALILNYPVVMGKYGQHLGVVSDYLTVNYDKAKDKYSVSFNKQAMYAKALSKAMPSTDVRASWNLHRANNGDIDDLAGYNGSSHCNITLGSTGDASRLDSARSGAMIIVFDSVTSTSLASFYKMPARSINFQQSNRKTVKDGSKVIEVVPDTVANVPSGCTAGEFASGIESLLTVMYNHESIKASMSIESTVRSFREVLKSTLAKIDSYRDLIAEYTLYSRSLGMVKRMQEYYNQIKDIDYGSLPHNKLGYTEGTVFSDFDLINANTVLAAHQANFRKEFSEEDAERLSQLTNEVREINLEMKTLSTVVPIVQEHVVYRIENGAPVKKIFSDVPGGSFNADEVRCFTKESTEVLKFFRSSCEEGAWLFYPVANASNIENMTFYVTSLKSSVTDKGVEHPYTQAKKSLVKRLAAVNQNIAEVQKREMTNLYIDDLVVEDGEVYVEAGNITSRWDLSNSVLTLRTISFKTDVSNKSVNLYGGFVTIRSLLNILDRYDVSTEILTRIRVQIARAFGFASVSNLKKNLSDLDQGNLTNREMFILKNIISRPSVDLNQEEFILSSALFGVMVSELCYSRLLLAEGSKSSELLSPAAYTLFKEVI